MAAAFPAPAAEADRSAGDEQFEEQVRFFSSFLHNNRDEWEKKITKELANGHYRIPLELKDLETNSPGLVKNFLNSPVKFMLPWETALHSFLRDINDKAVKTLKQELKLDPRGAMGRNHVTPRGMTSITLHKLMSIEGVVTKASAGEPKLMQSIHPRKNEDGHVLQRDQRDATAFVDAQTVGAFPTHDREGYELTMEIGLSVYKDEQKFTMQEAPEQCPPGQIPRHVEVVCDGQLANKVKPGDRVQVVGVYKGFPPSMQDFTSGVWPARVIATSVTPVTALEEAPFVSQDVRNIKEIAEREDTFALLGRSFAPSICGHERVKQGLLLQLIGGTEKNLENGTHLRGDINLLMIGDPSCGKSQMLRFVMNTSPLAISTTGRGSSGVGLTAAMLREPGNKDFTIEAGAMVLADRGMICIDEFDKMNSADRVAIHEAMEQQCVTIAKAGMHVTLNARCSVVAAANPQYGNFDDTKSLPDNIGMADSLLSRFDLVFVVRDLTDETIDRKIATQVLSQARQRLNSSGMRRGVEQIHSSIIERREQVDKQKSQEATEMFEKAGEELEGRKEVVTVDFLRKYVRYCKRFQPVLSEEAQDMIAKKYCDMRTRFQTSFASQRDPNNQTKPKLAVTTRTLEALIRLSTAHAKMKLRKDEVLPVDVLEACNLMLSAREEEPSGLDMAAPVGGAPDDDDAPGGVGSKKRKSEGDDDEAPPNKKTGTITNPRQRVLETLVGRTFARMMHGVSQMQQEDLMMEVNADLAAGEEQFSQAEFMAGLTSLEVANKVYVSETGEIALIS